MTENTFRETLAAWFPEMLSALGWAKERFSGTEKESALNKWELDLMSLKAESESPDSTMADEELYRLAAVLYEQIERFVEDETVDVHREETGRVPVVPIGGHRLPALPYPYDALEPVIDEETMRLHHLKHHQTYVDGLNKAEREMQKARNQGDFSLIKHWEREAAFHGSGHYLHSIFWRIMSPEGGGAPTGHLAGMINASFGSFEKFRKHFSEAAKSVEGSGWAILVWSPMAGRLEVLTAEKHQNLTQWTVDPLLVLDVWEHAYYLSYKNDRARYIENWWKVVNWREVERRLSEVN